ncbi:proliferation-associated protein 2G4-like [Paramacrobiotus metropolitanus]|uniref:proliferation-associated protein 2G4-like n=1 Tax=Paramacrobiotus metropolitanus TaxID=2943436 RepID=UPI0024465CC2|nr:proliferation-associated protein 2G4-like [Paramacrobiotus metropolitanus]
MLIPSPDPEPFIIGSKDMGDKCKRAGQIANKVVDSLLEKCVPSQSVRELCEAADAMIVAETSLVFKANLYKGVAFPTCISVNNCVCYFSPLKADPDRLLDHGDLVKIELAVHIDGYTASVGYSHVVGATMDSPASGRHADVMLATNAAMEAYSQLIKGGVEFDYCKAKRMVETVVQGFQCKLMHMLPEGKTKFHVNEVAQLEILVSTGEGLAYEYLDTESNIFRWNDLSDSLPRSASRGAKKFLAETSSKYGTSSFSLRYFDDEETARLSAQECVDHGILLGFPVLYEKEGELVALLKCTVGITPTGIQTLTGCSLNVDAYISNHKIVDVDLEAQCSYRVEMRVDPKYHFQLIGQSVQLNKIRDEFQVELQFPRSDAAAEDADKIVIVGLESQAHAARDKIQTIVEAEKSQSQVKVPLDSRIHARIIGDNRTGLQQLEHRFQVKINFPRRDDEDANVVTVVGEEGNVHACEAELKRLEGIYLNDVAKKTAGAHRSTATGPGRQDAKSKRKSPVAMSAKPSRRGRPKKGAKPRTGVLKGMLRKALRNRHVRAFSEEEKREVVGVYRTYPSEATEIANILNCTGLSRNTIYSWFDECERASGHTSVGG